MKLIKFTKYVVYGDLVFEKDNVYALQNKPAGFIDRWLLRGHLEVEKAEKVYPDPRFPEMNTSKYECTKEEIKPIIVGAKEVAPKVEKDKPRPKQKAKTKK